MKRSLLVIAALILSVALMAGLIACGDNDDEMQGFLDQQNEIFEKMRTDELSIELSAENDTLVYTYTLYIEGVSPETVQAIANPVLEQGQELFAAAHKSLPHVTAVVINFVDTEGVLLTSEEFK